MEKPITESITSADNAIDCISWISGYETEVDVEAASKRIVQFFDLQYFAFGALYKSVEQEHYRYIFGFAPDWCYRYIQNKWYAIDPFIGYALKNTLPILASDIPLTSPGQHRMMDAAIDRGFRSGIFVPVHSASSSWIGLLYLWTGEENNQVRRSFDTHRNLMRTFGLELLEWCDARLHANSLTDYNLDQLDEDLLRKAQENLTVTESAYEIGITFSLAKSRYTQLLQKLNVSNKHCAIEKAIALGIIKPIS